MLSEVDELELIRVLADDTLEIPDVVGNRGVTILARHPTRDDLLIAARIKPVQSLHGDQPPGIGTGNPPHLFEKDRGVLCVPVTADQDAAGKHDGRILHEDPAVCGGLDKDRAHGPVI